MNVYEEIIKRGAVKCVVHFSGGNDSGGADSIELLDEKDKVVGTIDRWKKNNPSKDAELYDLLCQPIYDRWGGFCGDYSVYGDLTWDAVTGTKKMTGQESSYQGFEY